MDKPGSEPAPNGCSTPTGNNPTMCTNTSFEGACNSHDICYGTCNSSKSNCDSTFGDDMAAVCDALEGAEWLACFVPCTTWRATYWVAVSLVGQDAYESRQVAECSCCDC